MERIHMRAKSNLLPAQPTQAETAVKCIHHLCLLLLILTMHAQYFALVNLNLKLQS